MSERKVINKYFPPDFDPSKIKRRKLGKDPQQPVRLMAPFSMRCNRCGEYIYKGKKFNARKELAAGEEYHGIKRFRFYIKCPVCSSEITFKTDPQNADYIAEHGATRNFENWSESDPLGKRTALPDAAEDDEYDSDGNPLESKKERDAMADLERSQEQSRREMEMMDELADLRQRNARLEQSNINADPESLLEALHAERETAEQNARRAIEEAEDDALVAQYFSKVAANTPGANGTNGDSAKTSSKGKARANGERPDDANGDGPAEGDQDDNSEDSGDAESALPALTIKRRPAPGLSNGSNGAAEPSVASLLAAKGKMLGNGNGTANGSAGIGNGSKAMNGAAASAAQIKRKREGLQKVLGIKKKVKA